MKMEMEMIKKSKKYKCEYYLSITKIYLQKCNRKNIST